MFLDCIWGKLEQIHISYITIYISNPKGREWGIAMPWASHTLSKTRSTKLSENLFLLEKCYCNNAPSKKNCASGTSVCTVPEGFPPLTFCSWHLSKLFILDGYILVIHSSALLLPSALPASGFITHWTSWWCLCQNCHFTASGTQIPNRLLHVFLMIA